MLLAVSLAHAGLFSPAPLEVTVVAADLPEADASGRRWEDGDGAASAARDALVGAVGQAGLGGAVAAAALQGGFGAFAAPDVRGTLLDAATGVEVTVPLVPDSRTPAWGGADAAVLAGFVPTRRAEVVVTLWDDDLDDDDLIGTARVGGRALRRAARLGEPVVAPLTDPAGRPVGAVRIGAVRSSARGD